MDQLYLRIKRDWPLPLTSSPPEGPASPISRLQSLQVLGNSVKQISVTVGDSSGVKCQRQLRLQVNREKVSRRTELQTEIISPR